ESSYSATPRFAAARLPWFYFCSESLCSAGRSGT
ncbi:invasion protein, partial [Shigella boydii]